MPREGRARGQASRAAGVDLRHRAAYRFRYVKEYTACAKDLGPDAYARVTAVLQTRFETAWRSGAPPRELRQRFDFKPLSGGARALRVCQIDVLKAYRVALIDAASSSPPTIYYLLVYRRDSTNDRDYERAALIAARIWKELEEG